MRTAERERASTFARTVLYLVAWLGFLVGAVALTARFVPVTGHGILIVAALAPYLMFGAAMSAALLLFARQWWAATAALLLLAASLYVQVPLFIGSGAEPVDDVPIRVVTANVHEGQADPDELAALGRDHADVFVLQELTPELADRLSRTELESSLRYRVLAARSGGAGIGIWSRHPIQRSVEIPGYRLGMISAQIDTPGTASTTVIALHLVGPWPQPIDDWRDEIARLPTTLNDAAAKADGRPVIVAGDFNATLDLAPLRRAMGSTFRDAAEQSGAGLTPTFPADRAIPLIGIDRVLTLRCSAYDVRTMRVPGSDHLALLATVGVPPDAVHS